MNLISLRIKHLMLPHFLFIQQVTSKVIKISYTSQGWVPLDWGSNRILCIKCILINVCTQRHAGKCFATASPKANWKKPLIYSLSQCLGVSTLTMADSKLPSWRHWRKTWKEVGIIGPCELKPGVSGTPQVVPRNSK